tara:strand:+ start:100 stop:546 length:447 start_codon:yes stop_codon:yes gene_type:complete
MPSFSDIYVISEKRNREIIDLFLNEFLPIRDESADEYEFPQYSENPEVIFRKAEEALDKCVAEKNTEYSLYWQALDRRKPEHAMVFFLPDSHVIFGVSTDDAYPEFAVQLLEKMKLFLGSDLGYIGHEAAPEAISLEQFKVEINAHNP